MNLRKIYGRFLWREGLREKLCIWLTHSQTMPDTSNDCLAFSSWCLLLMFHCHYLFLPNPWFFPWTTCTWRGGCCLLWCPSLPLLGAQRHLQHRCWVLLLLGQLQPSPAWAAAPHSAGFAAPQDSLPLRGCPGVQVGSAHTPGAPVELCKPTGSSCGGNWGKFLLWA